MHLSKKKPEIIIIHLYCMGSQTYADISEIYQISDRIMVNSNTDKKICVFNQLSNRNLICKK